MSEENKSLKDQLTDLGEELGAISDETKSDVVMAVEALSQQLTQDLEISFPELNLNFEFTVKAIDVKTQIQLEQLSFQSDYERKRFIANKCIVKPKLTPFILDKFTISMLDTIVGLANALSFSFQTRVEPLTPSHTPLSENGSGTSAKQ